MSRWLSKVLQAGCLLAVMLMLVPAPGRAQSLADLARQERAKKQSKTVKEYTNDDIPKATLSGSPAAPATAKAEAAKGEEGKDGEPAKKDDTEQKQADLEKEYREKAVKLKENLTTEERRLDVLQRELNLAQQQYYSDPNVALREQYSRDDINKRTAEIEAQQQNVDKAKQAITDLEEELRKKDLPPGWARAQ
jgi:hypothetical protein